MCLQFLTLELCCHPNRQEVDYVLNGFSYGFHFGIHPEPTTIKPARQFSTDLLNSMACVTQSFLKMGIVKPFNLVPEKDVYEDVKVTKLECVRETLG